MIIELKYELSYSMLELSCKNSFGFGLPNNQAKCGLDLVFIKVQNSTRDYFNKYTI